MALAQAGTMGFEIVMFDGVQAVRLVIDRIDFPLLASRMQNCDIKVPAAPRTSPLAPRPPPLAPRLVSRLTSPHLAQLRCSALQS